MRMDNAWHDMATHPHDGMMFVAINNRAGADSIRVVCYSDDEEEFRVVGRNESYAPGIFTHWCCVVPPQPRMDF